ncbi:sugar phosphate isomerase/epimerase [Microbacterium sp. cf332]|uniref:sugar phosphate isomerase/epimerase family protein n=1 Tax=Microbacterium sp. cf332 TaxID=1761804 RepID=UPI0008908E2A|nr:sugar phosphate isomerase/epimerase [Microbacterium sp. cf332]SDQ58173.1 Sugar phosphate isomerase/epimerase [Microbacterium sp. cf332]
MAIQIGIQLYSVRNSLAADPEGTLNALADMGLTRLEGANHRALTEDGIGFGIPADFLARMMEERGIEIIGCQINPLDLDRLPAVLDFQEQIGNRRIGCDIEFYPYGDLEYVKRRADFFTEVGRVAAERGMTFFYHNHYQEFQRFGDRTVYELLMDYTDPDLVKFELDTYWAYRGGADPIELFRTYPDRFVMSHQKDFPAGAARPLNMYEGSVAPDASIDMPLFLELEKPEEFGEVGTGVLPIQDIIDAAAQLPNYEYMLLEQDYAPGAELDSVRRSVEAFSRYEGITL